MTYSVIAILAIVIHLIINTDVLRRGAEARFPAVKYYRWFLFSVLAYHVTDALWGILYEHRLTALNFADTSLYFAAMALSVLFWTVFTVQYLGRESRFGKALTYTGQLLALFQLLVVFINLFTPVLFRFDEAGEYTAAPVRYVALTLQMLMFLGTSVYTLYTARRSQGMGKRRHLTIAMFGIIMVLANAAQISYPLLPLYSVGFLLGGCLLHTYVVEDEKASYLRELGAAKQLAYTDSLTGVKSKRAFTEAEEKMDARMAESEVTAFAAAIFDLNGLKQINDTRGHEVGDESIVAACRLVCRTFQHSPVFRIGGDEFAAILEGPDFDDRYALLDRFNAAIEDNLTRGDVSVSAGLADYDKVRDDVFSDVLKRADQAMYRRKRELKELAAEKR